MRISDWSSDVCSSDLWRSMLRLPVTLDQAVETIPNTAPSLHLGYIRPERSAVPSRNFGAVDHKLLPIPGERTIEKTDVPEQIQTPHGQISLRKLPAGRSALRNDNNDTLITIVRTA